MRMRAMACQLRDLHLPLPLPLPLPLQMAPRKTRGSRRYVVAEVAEVAEEEDEAVDEAVEGADDEAVEGADDEADEEADDEAVEGADDEADEEADDAEDLESQLKRILTGAPALPDSIALTHRLDPPPCKSQTFYPPTWPPSSRKATRTCARRLQDSRAAPQSSLKI
jgi:hypothetical protein